MKTISEVFGVGETKKFAVPGRYFRVLTSTGPVDVEFFNGGKPNGEKALAVEAGFYAMPPDGFVEIAITSPTAQTVKFAISLGFGGYDRSAGDVNVTDRAARLLGIVYGDLAQLKQQSINASEALSATTKALLARDVGIAPGATFASTTVTGAASTLTILAVASNTNGLILWDLQYQATGAAGQNNGILAQTAAPATLIDGDVLLVCHQLTGNFDAGNWLTRARFIASGKGMFLRTGAAGEATKYLSAAWTAF